MEMSLELLKRQVQKLANRPVEIETTRSGKFICKFIDFNMSPISLIGETEVEAYQKLYKYLLDKKPADTDPDGPAAA